MNPTRLTEPQRQALQWLSSLRDDQADEQQRRQFENWLNTAPEHADAYRQVQQFWQQLGGLSDLPETRLDQARSFVRRNQLARRRRNLTLVIAVLALGLGIRYPEPLQKWMAVPYQTVKGTRQNVILSDGSRIELNTGTKLRVDRFGSRTVWLEQGEAWFDVKHDAEQPFEVRVGAARIRDVGTQFNVLVDREQTTVAVTEGEVSLNLPGEPALSLAAGLQAGFSADGALQTPSATNADTAAWRSGILVFKHQRLPDVLRQLSRYHPVEFELADANLQTLSVSGRFSTTDLDESLSTLQNGLGVRIARTAAGKITIRAPNK
ncbi:FecR family protein [Methylomonas methanica]|uniref:Anti-FecI sigma factor, FecR n=1 Tax=Methylomonas methanica (strain DSM 25384 / MC09) TaxID=857087 RepID=G0A122_METMM|nr:FecR family protein [Methylomonas methanica]AEG01278.1 anti-FecI sigma factor, FecR [Methylomonas methanica MC09]